MEADPITDETIGTPRFEPTEAEIREACREIQSEWSRETEISRRAVPPSRELDYGRPITVNFD